MKKNKRKKSIFCFLIISALVLSWYYGETLVRLECHTPSGEAVDYLEHNGREGLEQQFPHQQLCMAGMVNVVRFKHCGWKVRERSSDLVMQFTYLAMIFLISGVLFIARKGRLFVRFKTCVFLKARFLYELGICKKKDGEKWMLIAA